MNVLLISTGRLPAPYFEKARAELGDGDIVIDVLAWSPPREPVDEVLCHFLLLGPGQMPTPESTQNGISNPWPEWPGMSPTDPAPMSETGLPSRVVPRRWSRARIKASLLRRLKRAKRSRVAHHARRLTFGGPSRRLWRQVRRNPQAQRLVENADLFVVVDAGAVRTGWHSARRNPTAGAVFGLPAAARHVARRGFGVIGDDHQPVGGLTERSANP